MDTRPGGFDDMITYNMFNVLFQGSILTGRNLFNGCTCLDIPVVRSLWFC